MVYLHRLTQLKSYHRIVDLPTAKKTLVVHHIKTVARQPYSIYLIGRRSAVSLNRYHFATVCPFVRSDRDNFLTLLGFSHPKHLLSGQNAQALESINALGWCWYQGELPCHRHITILARVLSICHSLILSNHAVACLRAGSFLFTHELERQGVTLFHL